jgi:hypothetical protein
MAGLISDERRRATRKEAQAESRPGAARRLD